MNNLITYSLLKKHTENVENPHSVTSEQILNAPNNTINEDTMIEGIPIGVTINYSDSFPSLPFTHVTVVTMRPTTSEVAHQFAFQRALSSSVYVRYVSSAGNWSDFKEVSYV